MAATPLDLTLGGEGNSSIVELDNSREESMGEGMGALVGALREDTTNTGGPQGGVVSVLAQLISQMQANHKLTLQEVFEGTRGTKRSREGDEDNKDLERSKPIMVDIKEHHLKDDATTVGDWVARGGLKPWKGDAKEQWANLPRKVLPVLADLRLKDVWEGQINPSLAEKLHDRGAETKAKQWLSSNHGVEQRGGHVRVDTDKTSGAFEYSYVEASGVHDAVGAIYNYAMALGSVRNEDKSGMVLLGVLHKIRFFAAARIEAKQQKNIIMDLFNDTLMMNAVRGRSMEPPLTFREVMDLAKEKLNEVSLDGMASVMGVECYGGKRKEFSMTNSNGNKGGSSGQGGYNAQGGNKGSGGSGGKGQGSRGYGQGAQGKTSTGQSQKDKLGDICWDFNGENGKAGCTFPHCRYDIYEDGTFYNVILFRFKHMCSKVGPTGMSCWAMDHGKSDHK